MRNIHALNLCDLSVPQGWKIVRNRLFEIEPEAAHLILPADGLTVWHACFNEDLLFYESVAQEVALDVSWLPDASPAGEYVAKIVRRMEGRGPAGMTPYDWEHPVDQFNTRSLADLLIRCAGWINQYGEPA